MRMRIPVALVAMMVAGFVSGGCSNDYFEGPRLNENPNKPSTAAADQQFVGFQAFTFSALTGDVNRLASLWMQQMAGTGRQWAGYDQYTVTENDFTMGSFFAQGALVDIRGVQSKVQDNKLYLGIAQTWEALLMDLTSDVWGDIPYSQAVSTVLHPELDKQIAVHNALLALVDQGHHEHGRRGRRAYRRRPRLRRRPGEVDGGGTYAQGAPLHAPRGDRCGQLREGAHRDGCRDLIRRQRFHDVSQQYDG